MSYPYIARALASSASVGWYQCSCTFSLRPPVSVVAVLKAAATGEPLNDAIRAWNPASERVKVSRTSMFEAQSAVVADAKSRGVSGGISRKAL